MGNHSEPQFPFLEKGAILVPTSLVWQGELEHGVYGHAWFAYFYQGVSLLGIGEADMIPSPSVMLPRSPRLCSVVPVTLTS